MLINADRLWNGLGEMARIGATPKGGVCRLALTDRDKEGRDLFVSWCREAGCSIRVDQLGNIFARREGTNPERPPVVTGSHLDTQPTGGRFDGVYGVLAGLEVVRTLNDHGRTTQAPIEVAAWTNEEGSRFPPAMVASGAFAGVFDLQYALYELTSKEKLSGRSWCASATPVMRPSEGVASRPSSSSISNRVLFSKPSEKPSGSSRALRGSAGTR